MLPVPSAQPPRPHESIIKRVCARTSAGEERLILDAQIDRRTARLRPAMGEAIGAILELGVGFHVLVLTVTDDGGKTMGAPVQVKVDIGMDDVHAGRPAKRERSQFTMTTP